MLTTRLAILNLPLAERERLALEEAERQRSDEVQAAAKETAISAAEDARLAEEARQRALEAAQAARTAIQRQLAEERAKAEGIRRDQAQLRGRLATTRSEFENRRQHGDWPGRDLPPAIADVKPDSASAAALYDELVDAHKLLRMELRDALDNAEHPTETPRYEPDLPSAPSDAPPTIISEIKALDKTAIELEIAADELDTVARTLALDILDATFENESRLYNARIALLDKLPAKKYDSVLGLGREGIGQLQRELKRLFLATRWYRIQRQGTPRRLLSDLGDFYTLAQYASIVAWLLLLAWLALYGIRNGARHLKVLRKLAIGTVQRASLIRLLHGLFDALEALVRPIVLFVATLFVWPALGEAQAVPEFAAIYQILFYLATYRLLLRAAHIGIARLINRHIAPEVSAKILRSLQLIGRTALTIAIFLAISERILGKGYLYRLVLGFAWLGALPIAAILIRWWRKTIADAYLKFSDSGAMADAVRKTRGKWYGFFVATAAVCILFVVGVIRFARQFVLGFEQSRKALAFVFRRRLERQAEDIDDARPRILPQDLVEHLSTAPVERDGDLCLDFFPEFDTWAEQFAAWRHSKSVGATLLVGRPGNGKTSWLRAACEHAKKLDQVEVCSFSIRKRILSIDGLVAFLGQHLEAPAEATASLAHLRDWLVQGPRRLISIDNLHSLFLRGVDTNAAWEAFDDLVAETGRKVYWLATIEREPFEYLCWAYRGHGAFRRVIALRGWPEDKIAALLHHRTSLAGYRVVYDDLVIDRVEGLEAQAQLVGTELEYARLLWDYADGSPAVALDCWRASLVSDGERCIRVRLFRRPKEALLEELGEPQRFMLAAVLWHGRLTAEEATVSLRYRADHCAEGLDLLVDWGVLSCEDGQYRTTIPWQPAIYRYLRRHHLIED
ncbi:MAG TPA: hypothetical protein ENJ18_14955 [Nannocystis exedens]|nr:hypothetical protein [Nannocystis exedens]